MTQTYTTPEKNYIRTHVNSYKPWIIRITNSEPTDDITTIIGEVQNMQCIDRFRFIALGFEENNTTAIKRLTDVVFRQHGTDFTDFFAWLCKCISVITHTKESEKPQLPPLEGKVYRDK
jgi:uncharacterized protein YegL